MALVGEMKNLTIGNKTYHIPIPTKTSDLQNDSNFMSGMTILSYGTSTWNDFLTAYRANHVVYCRASSNANPASGSQTRMAFMAYVSNATNPTNVEFQYYRSVSSHTSSQQGDQVYVYQLTSANAWTVTVREASVKIKINANNEGIKTTYSSGTVSIGHANSVTAQTTQAIYPIKIDAQGHISEYGNAVTIPTVDQTYDSTSANAQSGVAVASAIASLPEPMLFKGSLGTGGTITSLPSAAASNEGFVYKVITAGTYASQAAKVGDTFISDGSNWVLIPSGDEPSGTVTSVGVANATNGGLSISGSPITSSGTITVGHSNILTNAQSTQGVYPITIDKNGHIASYGNAVDVSPEIFIAEYDETSYADARAAFNEGKHLICVDGENGIYAPLSYESSNNLIFRVLNESSVGYGGQTYTLNSSGWTASGLAFSDEKMKWTASKSSNEYYPLQSTSAATTSTANTLNGITFYQYYNTAGGYRRLNLGNSIDYKSNGGAYGAIRLYGAAATYYGELLPGTIGTTSGDGHLTANRTWTLPDKTGTIALTSDVPDISGKQDTLVSGTNIKTINNTSLLGSGDITIASSSKNIWYGTCTTPSATTNKVVTTTTGDFQLEAGNMVRVWFSQGQTASSAKLVVDNTTETYISTDGVSGILDCPWRNQETVDFVYNGTYFIISDAGKASTDYYGVTKLSSSTSSTSTSLAATPSAVKAAYDLANSKQDALVSGTNVKTVNNNSLLGSGNISVLAENSNGDISVTRNISAGGRTTTADMSAQEISAFVNTVPSGFDNLTNLSVTNHLAAGGDITAGGSIAVSGHSSAIGTVKVQYASAKSVSSATNTNLTSISLEAGTWVITGGVRFPNNATGYRRMNISTSNASGWADVQLPALSGASTQLAYTVVVSPTSTTTYYLNCYHNAGVDLDFVAGGSENGLNFIRAVRIA